MENYKTRRGKFDLSLVLLVCWLQIGAGLFWLVVLSMTAWMSVARNRMVFGPAVGAGPNGPRLGPDGPHACRGGGDRQQHLNLIL